MLLLLVLGGLGGLAWFVVFWDNPELREDVRDRMKQDEYGEALDRIDETLFGLVAKGELRTEVRLGWEKKILELRQAGRHKDAVDEARKLLQRIEDSESAQKNLELSLADWLAPQVAELNGRLHGQHLARRLSVISSEFRCSTAYFARIGNTAGHSGNPGARELVAGFDV